MSRRAPPPADSPVPTPPEALPRFRAGPAGERFHTHAGSPWLLPIGGLVAAAGGYLVLGVMGTLPLPHNWDAPPGVTLAIALCIALVGGMVARQGGGALGRRLAMARNRQRLFPGPWLADYPWDPRGIDGPGSLRWRRTMAGALLLTAFLAPFNWWALANISGPLVDRLFFSPLIIGVGLFDLFLLAMWASTGHEFLRWLRHGSARLLFPHFPLAPGERVTVALPTHPLSPLAVTLRYVEEWQEAIPQPQGNSQKRLTGAVRYQRQWEVATPPGHTPRISFTLPDNPSWVTHLVPAPGVGYWELLLAAERPGVDFSTGFLLPVYPRSGPPMPGGITPNTPSAPAPGPARRVALSLGVVALAGGLLWLGSAWLERAAGITPRGMMTRLLLAELAKPHPDVGSEVMALRQGPDGRHWILSKHGLHRREPGGALVALIGGGRSTPPAQRGGATLSALFISGADAAWVGGWDGEILRYENGGWRVLRPRDPAGERDRIYALLPDGEGLLVASATGLRRWEPRRGQGEAVTALGRGRVTHLAREENGAVLAATGRGLWRRGPRGWEPHPGQPPEGGAIPLLQAARAGGWWVARGKRLYRLSGHACQELPAMAGVRTTGLAEGPDGTLWLTSWQEGLTRVTGAGPRRSLGKVPGTAFGNCELAWDGAGRSLLLGCYGHGFATLSGETLNALLP